MFVVVEKRYCTYYIYMASHRYVFSCGTKMKQENKQKKTINNLQCI